MKTLRFAFLLALVLAVGAAAQTTIQWDNSGNGLINGPYYFRHIIYQIDVKTAVITQASALYGTINFDGKGAYTVNGQLSDSTNSGGAPRAFSFQSGTYAISASGFGYLDNPLFANDFVIGGAAQGAFVGSSTDGTTNDLFIAIPMGSTQAGISTLNGKYWVGYYNLPASGGAQASDALFTATADGRGGFNPGVTATGWAGSATNQISQTLSSLTYTLSGGLGSLVFPSTGALVSGSKILYVSGDGNFAIAGSASAPDLAVLMRAPSTPLSNANFSGFYYASGLEIDNSSSPASIDSFYSGLKATGSGLILRHDRMAYYDGPAYDFTFDTSYSLSDGTGLYNSNSYNYAVATAGNGYLGIGRGPVVGLSFGVRAADLTGSGVFVNPMGVVNAASNAPFTAGLSRGEAITIYGTGLANNTGSAPLPFPATLNGVSVKINDRPAPVYYASPNQVNAIVPYETELSTAAIQVTNNGTVSNRVTVFMTETTPGVFSVPPGGVGYGAVLHADYSLVTSAKPAAKGETVLIYLTGLGDVTPPVTTGTPAPSSPLSVASSTFFVYVDGVQAKNTFAGLAPGFAGLYQINVVVPSSVNSGDLYLDIESDLNGFTTSQVKIPVK